MLSRFLDERESTSGSQSCGHELTFALNFEVNLMKEYGLDEEFRPVGCNGTLEKMWWLKDTDLRAWSQLSTVDCPANMERYEEGEALSEITTAFATNHDVWNELFLAGWDKFVENGYGEAELVVGPEYSWMGYSHYGL